MSKSMSAWGSGFASKPTARYRMGEVEEEGRCDVSVKLFTKPHYVRAGEHVL